LNKEVYKDDVAKKNKKSPVKKTEQKPEKKTLPETGK
ncbi:MAG: hypothetical protein JWO06_2399, partial [Bacteroidota bacterium]|nr:hypothetical protein [Bacteroidota bacterium]